LDEQIVMSQVGHLRLALLVTSALTVVLLGLVVIITQSAAIDPSSSADAVGDFGLAPNWTLTDQLERPVSSKLIGGRIVLADFIYTHCTDICPQLSLNMQAVQERLLAEGLLGHEVQLLSFTTDPARDTPDVLRAYAARHKADPDAWRFLTGPEATLVPLIVEGFRLGVQALPPATEGSDDSLTSTANTANYEVMHTGRFVLIDRQGHIRAYFDGQAFEPDRVIRVIRDLMREQ
jgi:protein SCO1